MSYDDPRKVTLILGVADLRFEFRFKTGTAPPAGRVPAAAHPISRGET